MKPKFCSIDIIDECVLRCKMCYKWKDAPTYNDLPSVEDWCRFIDSLELLCEKDKPEIVLAGGEAFLYKPLFEIIRYAKKKNFSTALASSAFLINESLVKKLADAGLTNITFSLDSLDRKTHDFLRGREGVFDSVIKAIDLFHETDVNICISAILMNTNLDEILSIAQWVRQNEKIQAVIFLMPMQPNSALPDTEWFKHEKYDFLWPKNPLRAIEVIDSIKRMRQQDEAAGIKSKICTTFAQMEAFKRYFVDPAIFVKEGQCPMTQGLHVSSVGDLFFCYSHPQFGNIKNDLVHEAWNSERAQSIRRKVSTCEKNCHFLLNCFFG